MGFRPAPRQRALRRRGRPRCSSRATTSPPRRETPRPLRPPAIPPPPSSPHARAARSPPPSAASRAASTASSIATRSRICSRSSRRRNWCASTAPPTSSSRGSPSAGKRRRTASPSHYYLRPNLTWSDGATFDADDVRFAFEAVYDPRTTSPLRDSLLVDGQPLEVLVEAPLVVRVKFPAPYGPGLRLLDALPVLPRHRLEGFHHEGTLASAWGVATPPSELAGLGPFVLTEYRPGERMAFARNPRYWRTDDRGVRLPYVDRLTLENRARPERRAPAAAGGADRSHAERAEARRLPAAPARLRAGRRRAARSGRRPRSRRALVQPVARGACRRPAARLARK